MSAIPGSVRVASMANPNIVSVAAPARLGALDPGELAAIAATPDPVGVISAYMNFSEGGQHRAETTVRRAFTLLKDGEDDGRSRREWSALLDDALERLVERMAVRPASGERARVVFIPVSGDS